ncbi:MAG: UDP-N-acetylmuramoylalanyl-D-glutamyl-2,6-diaminopimelate--D-alanyl-D-alanine ligase [Pseudomonadota bacterium]
MSAWLWTTQDMLAAMEGRAVGDVPHGVTGLSIDTRTILPGEAYLSIKGDVHDGHAFVANAFGAGGGLSVVAEDWLDHLSGETGPLIVVDDVLRALERLAVAARARTAARVVAITGSVGKTTTKEALRTGLSACGSVHAAVASFNNHWGVPLTLARMPEATDYAVIEIGMNHPGEITPLVKFARPHVAIINNVAAVHLGAFNSVDEIALAKSEIFAGLEPGGTAVLNADDPRLSIMQAEAAKAGVEHTMLFGEADNAHVRLLKLKMMEDCSCLTVDVRGEEMALKLGAPGRHIAQNALAVLAAAQLMGADLARVGLALGDVSAVKGRGQRHSLNLGGRQVALIDESYNANPTSMAAALALLGQAEVSGRGRRIAVLGDMLELGPTSSDLHAGMIDAILKAPVDRLWLAGPEMLALKEAAKRVGVAVDHVDDLGACIPALLNDLRDGDVVMAKASLGMGFARLIDAMLDAHSRATGAAKN